MQLVPRYSHMRLAMNFSGGIIAMIVVIALATYLSSNLDNWVFAEARSISGINWSPEYSSTLQTIISTALATFLGAWFAFRWQHHKEREEQHKDILRQVDYLIYYITGQHDYATAVGALYNRKNDQYTIPTFDLTLKRPETWDVGQFDLIISECLYQFKKLQLLQGEFEWIIRQSAILQEIITKSDDYIPALINQGKRDEFWIWQGTEQELAEAIGSEDAEHFIFVYNRMINTLEVLQNGLPECIEQTVDVLVQNKISSAATKWWAETKREPQS